MGSENVMGIVALSLVFGTGVVIAVSIFWLDHRTRQRALDVLRLYAERGEEPPVSVVQALTAVSGWGRQPGAAQPGAAATPPATRASHLAHAAANAVTVLGLAGLVWWRVSTSGEAGGMVIVAVLVGLFFAASLAARLVGAYYAADR
jgi:hypothetical protein